MLYLVFLFIAGTIVGSFLNVCIHRLPRGESIIFPYSHCPFCKHRLGALDLIPVLSYLALRGKCRHCKKTVSVYYLLVEILTGISFVGIARIFSPLEFFFYIVFVLLLTAVFFIDLENQIIPDVLSFLGIFTGLGYNFLKSLLSTGGANWNPFIFALYGLFLGYILLYAIGFAGKICFKKEAIGEGDFLLAAMLGAFLGWQGVLLSIFLAYLLAGVVLGVLLLVGKVKMGQYVPFGPALAAGGIATLFFGRQIISWYLGLVF